MVWFIRPNNLIICISGPRPRKCVWTWSHLSCSCNIYWHCHLCFVLGGHRDHIHCLQVRCLMHFECEDVRSLWLLSSIVWMRPATQLLLEERLYPMKLRWQLHNGTFPDHTHHHSWEWDMLEEANLIPRFQLQYALTGVNVDIGRQLLLSFFCIV